MDQWARSVRTAGDALQHAHIAQLSVEVEMYGAATKCPWDGLKLSHALEVQQ
jgi:hypothetical protein